VQQESAQVARVSHEAVGAAGNDGVAAFRLDAHRGDEKGVRRHRPDEDDVIPYRRDGEAGQAHAERHRRRPPQAHVEAGRHVLGEHRQPHGHQQRRVPRPAIRVRAGALGEHLGVDGQDEHHRRRRPDDIDAGQRPACPPVPPPRDAEQQGDEDGVPGRLAQHPAHRAAAIEVPHAAARPLARSITRSAHLAYTASCERRMTCLSRAICASTSSAASRRCASKLTNGSSSSSGSGIS
jgi:hypothetical protein